MFRRERGAGGVLCSAKATLARDRPHECITVIPHSRVARRIVAATMISSVSLPLDDHRAITERLQSRGMDSGMDSRDWCHKSTHWTYALSTPSKLSKTHLLKYQRRSAVHPTRKAHTTHCIVSPTSCAKCSVLDLGRMTSISTIRSSLLSHWLVIGPVAVFPIVSRSRLWSSLPDMIALYIANLQYGIKPRHKIQHPRELVL